MFNRTTSSRILFVELPFPWTFNLDFPINTVGNALFLLRTETTNIHVFWVYTSKPIAHVPNRVIVFHSDQFFVMRLVLLIWFMQTHTEELIVSVRNGQISEFTCFPIYLPPSLFFSPFLFLPFFPSQCNKNYRLPSSEDLSSYFIVFRLRISDS